MCLAKDEDGVGWSEDQIVNQFNLLIMAAHDTTATALTVMMAALGAHPDWQQRLVEEVAALGDGPLDEDSLNAMPETDKVFREALRLVPPVPFIPRMATRDFHWQGFDIPRGHLARAQSGRHDALARAFQQSAELRSRSVFTSGRRTGCTALPGRLSAVARTNASGCISPRCR